MKVQSGLQNDNGGVQIDLETVLQQHKKVQAH